MGENDRIKLIRVTMKLNQTEFGERIGIKTSSVSEIERGKNTVTQQVRKAICREFGVSETWLRTGEGEMFAARSREDELAGTVNSLLSGEDSEFRRRLITALSRFSPSDWQRLEQELRFILEGNSSPVPAHAASTDEPEEPPKPETPHGRLTPEEWDALEDDERAFLAEYRRQKEDQEKNGRENRGPVDGVAG